MNVTIKDLNLDMEVPFQKQQKLLWEKFKDDEKLMANLIEEDLLKNSHIKAKVVRSIEGKKSTIFTIIASVEGNRKNFTIKGARKPMKPFTHKNKGFTKDFVELLNQRAKNGLPPANYDGMYEEMKSRFPHLTGNQFKSYVYDKRFQKRHQFTYDSVNRTIRTTKPVKKRS